jgi:hypothetical protein
MLLGCARSEVGEVRMRHEHLGGGEGEERGEEEGPSQCRSSAFAIRRGRMGEEWDGRFRATRTRSRWVADTDMPHRASASLL